MEYNKNPYDLEPSITMQELYDKWLPEYEKTVKSTKSVTSAWAYCSGVYKMRVMDIRARHVKGCMEEGVAVIRGKEQHPSATMKNQIKSLFNMMLDYALEYELVDRNYSRTFNLTEETVKEIQSVKKEHIAFTDEEMDLLWANISNKQGIDILLIQCYSGWRPQELGLLELKDVDLENWTFRGGMKTDAGENRVVPIHSRIQDLVLRKYQEAEALGSPYLLNWTDLNNRNKKNIILQGAPGVGKTFAARRLAWSMMGEKDDSRIEFVQFHQNYSYEDFMMGYKPVEDGFELKYGIFYRFCQKAANQPDKEFFFIIDEINRGNMSKIFGELLMLIEKDYRGTKATLAYNGLSFSVPKNLYIIGMMNTADRSLAMIDYALRRRFSFFEVEPGFDSEGFIHYQNGLNNETLNELVDKVKDLNREISLDKSLGKGFCIGHSYFCGRDVCTEEWLHSIVDYDILPMLSEYWFDDANKLQRWENILQGVFQ